MRFHLRFLLCVQFASVVVGCAPSPSLPSPSTPTPSSDAAPVATADGGTGGDVGPGLADSSPLMPDVGLVDAAPPITTDCAAVGDTCTLDDGSTGICGRDFVTIRCYAEIGRPCAGSVCEGEFCCTTDTCQRSGSCSPPGLGWDYAMCTFGAPGALPPDGTSCESLNGTGICQAGVCNVM